MISLRKFSKLAGVSPATVSRAFSNAKGLSEETRERILEIAERVDFRPSAIGSVAFGGKTRSVGVILPGFRVSYFMDIACGIQEYLIAKNHLPILLDSSVSSMADCLKRMMDHRIDALIINIINEETTKEDFADLIKLNIPIMVIGPVLGGLQCDSIDTDDTMGGRLAAEHLLELGHKNVACTYYGAGMSSCDNRLRGFTSVLDKAGAEMQKKNIARLYPFRPSETEFRESVRSILSAPDPPTAFFATTDFHALEVLSVAKEMKLRVPEDLSIIGYADLVFSEHLLPALTTIRQDGKKVGLEAAKCVFKHMLENPDIAKTKKINHELVPVELIVRGSTAKI